MELQNDAVWWDLFPSVNFDDKVCIEFKSGESIVLKHLYADDSELFDIDWQNVADCFEV